MFSNLRAYYLRRSWPWTGFFSSVYSLRKWLHSSDAEVYSHTIIKLQQSSLPNDTRWSRHDCTDVTWRKQVSMLVTSPVDRSCVTDGWFTRQIPGDSLLRYFSRQRFFFNFEDSFITAQLTRPWWEEQWSRSTLSFIFCVSIGRKRTSKKCVAIRRVESAHWKISIDVLNFSSPLFLADRLRRCRDTGLPTGKQAKWQTVCRREHPSKEIRPLAVRMCFFSRLNVLFFFQASERTRNAEEREEERGRMGIAISSVIATNKANY